jgi:excinuclease ABC subunit C
MPSPDLQRKIDLLPVTPGVYLMKDRQGEVVYVGKARNLRSRVSQYFQPQTSDTRRFIPFLEELLGDLEVLLTPSEKDALLLENELIKKHKPRFNVRLRDDKNFISLRLSRTHPYPRLEVVRRIRKDGARYFGPYSSASSIRESLQVLNRHFQLRTCTDQVMANRRRPCLQYQIKRCPAPCVYEVPQEEYQRSIAEAALFLEGKADELTDKLRGRMLEAARGLEFERAASLRDQLQAIERSLEKQRTVFTDLIDQDVVGFHREGALLEVQLLFFRNGRLNGGRAFSFPRQEFPTEELLESFLAQYYEGGAVVPKELLLPLPLWGDEKAEGEAGAEARARAESFAQFLSEKRGDKVGVLAPERGEKLRLLEMAKENARHSFEERQRTEQNAVETLRRLQSRLRLARLPRRIECFDMSTFMGQQTVGSQVVFSDGEPDKARYRLYKVRGEAATDDFASMFQVLGRRLAKGIAENDLPDLILVDGGKGQLNVARAALKEAGLKLGTDIMLAGLAKSRVLEDEQRFARRGGFSLADAWAQKAGPEPEVEQLPEDGAGEDDGAPRAEGSAPESAAAAEGAPAAAIAPAPEESAAPANVPEPARPGDKAGRSRKKGRFTSDALERSPERVFLPGQKNPIVLRQNSSEMFLLQRLRDEAHRFAITFHRKLRRERNFKSVLEEVPGIGEKRKKALLSHFGSLKRIKAASASEIAGAPGFNAELAARVHEFLAAAKGPDDGADEVVPAEGVAPDAEVAFDAVSAELEAALQDELPDEAQDDASDPAAGGDGEPGE